MREIRTTIAIDAPPDAVWSVIADFGSYSEWNPFVVGISGDRKVGARLDVQISLRGKRRRFHPRVVDWQPGHSVRWAGVAYAGWLFRGEHGLAVEPLSAGRAQFVHDETFGGIALPFVTRMLRETEQGFRSMNDALKHRVEAQVRS